MSRQDIQTRRGNIRMNIRLTLTSGKVIALENTNPEITSLQEWIRSQFKDPTAAWYQPDKNRNAIIKIENIELIEEIEDE